MGALKRRLERVVSRVKGLAAAAAAHPALTQQQLVTHQLESGAAMRATGGESHGP